MSNSAAEGLRIITVIPARGGSKRIPAKNLLPLAGLPVVAHSVVHARNSALVSEVYVSTDDPEIAEVARRYGAEVVLRPPDLANDTATSESALLHVLDELNRQGKPDPDLMVFLQCTSPVRRPDDIDNAIRALLAEEADSLFSACEFNRLIWAVDGERLYSLNYNFHRRQREQEMAKQFRENGSIYVLKPEILRANDNRMGGKIAVYEMDFWSSYQIDAPEHVELIRWILQRPEYAPPFAWPDPLRLVVFDFDGVMTENSVVVAQDGSEAVVCNRGDGWGIARLRDAGVSMLVLSTEENPVVAARCAKLKLPCHQGIGNKGAYLAKLLQEKSIPAEGVIYLGNDVNDRECLEQVGCPALVGDAHPSVGDLARLKLTAPGGRGAVRELADRIQDALRAGLTHNLPVDLA